MVESGVKMLCDIREGQQMLSGGVKRILAAKRHLSQAARLSRCYRLVKTIAPTPISTARLPPTGDLREG